MKYPASLSIELKEVEEIVSKWPVEIDMKRVIKWIMQFDTEDIPLAVLVLRNLNVIGFDDFNNALSVAYSKLERMALDKGARITYKNTLFAGIGDNGKSGAMVGYNFRLINELPEENFMDEESIHHLEEGRIENIVLVDDIIATGKQATEEIKKLTEKVIPLGVKNIFLLTAVGMKEGIDIINEETKAYVFAAFEYNKQDTVTPIDASFYKDVPIDRRHQYLDRLKYYGKVTNNSSLGYGGLGCLIVFYYNVPNSTLPIIWGSRNSWIPLFRRVTRINGIDSYFKQIDSTVEEKKTKGKDAKESKQGKKKIKLFVEGKFDEEFFQIIIPYFIEKIPFDEISVISLGGFNSETLLNNLTEMEGPHIFIVEDDDSAPEPFKKKIKTMFKDRPAMFVKSFVNFLNINEVFDDTRFARSKDELLEISNDRDFMHQLERIIKQKIYRRPEGLKDIVEKYGDQVKIEALSNKIVSEINKNFAQQNA